MAIFTTLSVVIWFSTGILGIFATLICFYCACGNVRYTEYGNNSHTIDFHTVMYFVVYTIVNFTTQCGENRHTDIANFATLIHTPKINTLYGDFYHTVW